MAETAALKICVVGASGRMGRMILAEVIRRSDLALAGGVVSHDSAHLDADLGELAGQGHLGLATQVSVEEASRDADVVIDVSTARVAPAVARRLGETGAKALVCGVTGLDEAGTEALASAAETIPVLHARNFSLGVSVLEALVEHAAGALKSDQYDLEIHETHHRFKADAPSGTAMMLGEAGARGRGDDLGEVARFDYARQDARRPDGEIGFSVNRGGGIVGEHAVRFLGALEEIELSHRALDRFVFARGAVEAALWLSRQTPGRYSMRDVLGLKL
ncbi:4-hydroxy-tetrahydrodipicolinate reductase [Marinicauda sp. Alg238-R41]|uniref:4-hydroxy-tetrahydrodipicolinate reductase n=1 Tax=Marinicauda sp. Alg238-R41 TaxID=2993447 RepID=UPI0022E5D0BE|nr:4-hydroxy-tetrahydrodipicolinate reductase [Marinicauda sp. Alg238-R41]